MNRLKKRGASWPSPCPRSYSQKKPASWNSAQSSRVHLATSCIGQLADDCLPSRTSFTLGPTCALTPNTRGRSRMPELGEVAMSSFGRSLLMSVIRSRPVDPCVRAAERRMRQRAHERRATCYRMTPAAGPPHGVEPKCQRNRGQRRQRFDGRTAPALTPRPKSTGGSQPVTPAACLEKRSHRGRGTG